MQFAFEQMISLLYTTESIELSLIQDCHAKFGDWSMVIIE
jgi:hypothetical protein